MQCGKGYKLDLYHVLVLSTTPFFHMHKIISSLENIGEVLNYGKLLRNQIQIYFYDTC